VIVKIILIELERSILIFDSNFLILMKDFYFFCHFGDIHISYFLRRNIGIIIVIIIEVIVVVIIMVALVTAAKTHIIFIEKRIMIKIIFVIWSVFIRISRIIVLTISNIIIDWSDRGISIFIIIIMEFVEPASFLVKSIV